MSTLYRTISGGLVDRARPLSFTFNGKTYSGCEGDTLASALLANGVHLIGRSFKYHRPRGIMAAGADEPNAMVQLGTGARSEPNVKATQISLYDGLVAASVNAWPDVRFDVQAGFGAFSSLFPAGFYYKTMQSRLLWNHVYEPLVRRAAGWGKAPSGPDADIYDHKHVHCDVLVVGAGPAGLTAANVAASSGARVILADEQRQPGGALLGLDHRIDGVSAIQWIEAQRKSLQRHDCARILTHTCVLGAYDHNYLTAIEYRTDRTGRASSRGDPRARLWHIRAKSVIMATGAHERPLVFADNDRPGIMLAGAAQCYANRYGVLVGRRAVVFTNNDSAGEAARDFQRAGGEIVAIVDTRAPTSDRGNAGTTRPGGTEDIATFPGYGIAAVQGRRRVKGVRIRKITSDGTAFGGPAHELACDCVLTSGGWSPAVHLFSQAGGTLLYDSTACCFVPDTCPKAITCAGACNGVFSSAEAIAQGRATGVQAASYAGFEARAGALAMVDKPEPCAIAPAWLVPADGSRGQGPTKHFVDFQNDTTAADIQLAVREGFESVEHMKRYTLAGFGTDQGKTGNINALAILAQTLGQPIPQTGTTTFRPPYTPVPFGALAGREVEQMNDPVRVTSIHDLHVARGAVFEDVGQWKRPWYFPGSGEDMQQAVNRECLAVRHGVGMLDASTLGKIDIRGADAARFLDRVYTNAWAKLPIGAVRYGLMCHEDGMVFDDGTTARLGGNHYLMTTTTGGAAGVFEWLEEYLQTEWPDLRVFLTSVTEQWATVTVSGPKARAVMEKLCTDIDFSPAAFPFMTVENAAVAAIPARIFRISFTGELTYEINVPWNRGASLWQAIAAAGREFDITPYGTEAMHVLRAEKGFIIVGQETDGTVTPADLGMDWIVSKKKDDFIGKRSFSRTDTARAGRKQLVGLRTLEPRRVLPEGAQLVVTEKPGVPAAMHGHVTSSYFSATLGHSIALALVNNGRARVGETLYAPLPDETIACRITDPVFYDPRGERRDG